MPTSTLLTWLKILSLLVLTVCNHYSLSSPNPPPDDNERECYDGEKEADPVPRISLWMPPVWRVSGTFQRLCSLLTETSYFCRT